MATPGARPALALLLALLEALLPGSGGAQVSVTLKDAIVPPGGVTEVNCSATCDQVTYLGLETKLTKTLVAQGDAWKVFELRDVQDDSVQCFANCDEGQLEASANLTVYRLPERVELAPLPPWQPVGDTFTLRCRVSGGAPRTHLTVVLLRGQEELSRQPAEGEPAEVTATVSASREDHDANFSCRTDLDLRSQGLEVFQNSSTSWKLQTFALPVTSPLLSAPHILEVGENPTVSCSLDGVFPTWEAKVYIALGDQLQNASVTSDGDMLTATATLKADLMEGPQNLKCAVTLGNQTREKNQTVTVYSFPAPSLTLSELVVSEWTEVTVVCEARAATVVTLTGAPALVPTQTSASKAEFHLNASAQDNGRHFFCSAALHLHGQVLYKNQTQELQVLYGPRLNEEDCPGNWTWQEGSEKTLKCQAWGNPPPKLECHRKGDNFSLPIGDLKPVKREFAGTYLCRAVSTRGEVTRQVVMNVLYHQDNLAIIITVTAIVILGTVATAGYLYNRQRKIRIYRLKQAQEEASLKMNPPP